MKYVGLFFLSLAVLSVLGAARDGQLRGQRRPSRWVARQAGTFYRWILGIG